MRQGRKKRQKKRDAGGEMDRRKKKEKEGEREGGKEGPPCDQRPFLMAGSSTVFHRSSQARAVRCGHMDDIADHDTACPRLRNHSTCQVRLKSSSRFHRLCEPALTAREGWRARSWAGGRA